MSFESDVQEVFGNKPYFAMYTREGDVAVQAVVNIAKFARLTWPETYALLERLSQEEKYAEATDTAVRECVYAYLKFDTNFYI
jgi:hypothetical protein